jgi:hypothetical protein
MTHNDPDLPFAFLNNGRSRMLLLHCTNACFGSGETCSTSLAAWLGEAWRLVIDVTISASARMTWI